MRANSKEGDFLNFEYISIRELQIIPKSCKDGEISLQSLGKFI